MKTKEFDCTIGCNRLKTLNTDNLIVMFSEDEIRDFTTYFDNIFQPAYYAP